MDILAVTQTNRYEESAVGDMTRMMFLLFNYDDMGLAIRSRETLKLEMCNQVTRANPNICVQTLNGSKKVVVQEDKSYRIGETLDSVTVYAQLAAEMVAAFQENVRLLKMKGLQHDWEEQDMLGIVMMGTCPTFFRMNMTTTLSDSVKYGHYPEQETIL